MEPVSPFLGQSEEPFKNVEFIHFLASLITSEVRVDRLTLDWEDGVWVCGVVCTQWDRAWAANQQQHKEGDSSQRSSTVETKVPDEVCVREGEHPHLLGNRVLFVRVPTLLPGSGIPLYCVSFSFEWLNSFSGCCDQISFSTTMLLC